MRNRGIHRRQDFVQGTAESLRLILPFSESAHQSPHSSVGQSYGCPFRQNTILNGFHHSGNHTGGHQLEETCGGHRGLSSSQQLA